MLAGELKAYTQNTVTDPEAQLPAGVNFSAKTVTLLVLKKEALASFDYLLMLSSHSAG